VAGPTDLYDLAAALLAAASSSLDEILPPLVQAPDRRFVSYGVPSDDCCEQLVVYVNPIAELGTGLSQGPNQQGKRHARAWLNQALFVVQIGRCVPVVEVVGGKPVLPELAAIDAAAQQHLADGWALWNGIHNRVAAGDIFGSCDNIVFDPLNERSPSGGCAGWLMNIRAVVFGYQPAGS
jgi:hypothetical protein